MTPELLRFDALPVSAWRNGAGRKADIASATDWHVGFAWLDADAPFSDFSGHDRTITLLDGAGFVLAFTGHPPLRVAERYHPASFDGGWPTQCRLLDGPCLVLNAMTARARYRHNVSISDAAAINPGNGAAYLILLTGTATLLNGGNTIDLHPRDAIRADAPLQLRASADARLCTIHIDRN